MQLPTSLSPHDRRRIAVEAMSDPRTVDRYLAGRRTASTTSARIRLALTKLGLQFLVTPSQGAGHTDSGAR
jgi:hypothetical protein